MIYIDDILLKEIIPTLTDFLHNQIVFWKAMDQNKNFGTPIKNVLELGVYRLSYDIASNLPGQSTKTLMVLNHYYGFNKFISLDIDDCTSTIDNCKKWVSKYGIIVNNHSFIQSNSLNFDIKKYFPNGLDLIFLDTSHDDNYPEKLGYPGSGGAGMTYKELCHYAPHLSKNGRMFIHDTKNYYLPRAYGVNTEGALQKFLDKNKDFSFHEHNTNQHGLGELFRKNSNISELYKNS